MKLILLSLMFVSSVCFADRNEYEVLEWQKVNKFSIDGLDQAEVLDEDGNFDRNQTVGVAAEKAAKSNEPDQGLNMANPPGMMGAIPGMVPGASSGGPTLPAGLVPPGMPGVPGASGIRGSDIPVDLTKEQASEYGKAIRGVKDKYKDQPYSEAYVNDVFGEIEKVNKNQRKPK